MKAGGRAIKAAGRGMDSTSRLLKNSFLKNP
jgi:hypothetical protein